MRRAVLGALGLAAVLLVVVLALARKGVAGPRLEGRRAEGLWGGAAWLAARGVEVRPWDGDPARLPPGATLLVAGPLAAPPDPGWSEGLLRWVARGGTLAVALAPGEPGLRDRQLLDRLDVDLGAVEEPLVAPWRWPARSRRVVELVPRAGAPIRAAPVSRPGHQRVVPDPRLRVLAASPGGEAGWYALPFGRGRVWILDDASLLSNALVASEGNLALWAALGRDGLLLVDEASHAPFGAGGELAPDLAAVLAVLAGHALLGWALLLWSWRRPFGPPSPPTVVTGSTLGRDLAALARLHRRNGHAPEVAAAALRAARRLGYEVPDDPAPVRDDRDLLDLVRRLRPARRGRAP